MHLRANPIRTHSYHLIAGLACTDKAPLAEVDRAPHRSRLPQIFKHLLIFNHPPTLRLRYQTFTSFPFVTRVSQLTSTKHFQIIKFHPFQPPPPTIPAGPSPPAATPSEDKKDSKSSKEKKQAAAAQKKSSLLGSLMPGLPSWLKPKNQVGIAIHMRCF